MRVWVAGCSTGQEAYSIAMAYQEFSEHRARAPETQVFATNLDDTCRTRPDTDSTPGAWWMGSRPTQLRRFFVEEEGGYRVNKGLRDQVHFRAAGSVEQPALSHAWT